MFLTPYLHEHEQSLKQYGFRKKIYTELVSLIMKNIRTAFGVLYSLFERMNSRRNHNNFRSAACARPIFRFLSFRPRLANRPKSRTLSQTSQTPRSIRTHAIYNLHTVNSVTDQQSPKPTRDRDVKEAEVPTAPSSRFLS